MHMGQFVNVSVEGHNSSGPNRLSEAGLWVINLAGSCFSVHYIGMGRIRHRTH